jgi:hypothetical protein
MNWTSVLIGVLGVALAFRLMRRLGRDGWDWRPSWAAHADSSVRLSVDLEAGFRILCSVLDEMSRLRDIVADEDRRVVEARFRGGWRTSDVLLLGTVEPAGAEACEVVLECHTTIPQRYDWGVTRRLVQAVEARLRRDASA